jgi:hypothetical protein
MRLCLEKQLKQIKEKFPEIEKQIWDYWGVKYVDLEPEFVAELKQTEEKCPEKAEEKRRFQGLRPGEYGRMIERYHTETERCEYLRYGDLEQLMIDETKGVVVARSERIERHVYEGYTDERDFSFIGVMGDPRYTTPCFKWLHHDKHRQYLGWIDSVPKYKKVETGSICGIGVVKKLCVLEEEINLFVRMGDNELYKIEFTPCRPYMAHDFSLRVYTIEDIMKISKNALRKVSKEEYDEIKGIEL